MTMSVRYPLSRLLPVIACVAGLLPTGGAAQTPSAGSGQTWPTRPIRLVVPFPPGGATDANARVIAKEVENVLGQPLVIDNRGGANAIIGSEIIAKAVPDGYTLMHISVAFAINPSLYRKLPFDTSRDFTPITNPIVGQGSLLAVNPALPAKSVPEPIALGQTQKPTLGSPRVGTVL